MVYLVTGPRDSGKTTALQRIYKECGSGDGILSHKVIRDGSLIGYEAERLSTGIRVPLAVIHSMAGADWDEEARQGKFSFSRRGLSFTCSALEEIIFKNLSPIFIDEIGPMELSGKGLDPVRRAFDSGKDVYATVRDRYLQGVIEFFGILRYEIIHADLSAGSKSSMAAD